MRAIKPQKLANPAGTDLLGLPVVVQIPNALACLVQHSGWLHDCCIQLPLSP